MRRLYRKYKVIFYLTIILVVLPLSFYSILRSSSVQTFLTQKAAAYLSGQLNTQVKVGGIDISLFLDVIIEDVHIKDLYNNDILVAEKIIFDIHRISFMARKVTFRKIGLENTSFNLRKYEGYEEVNLKFLIDYFSSDKEKDPHKIPWAYETRRLFLNNVDFKLQDYNHEFTDKGMDFNNLDIGGIHADFRRISINGDTINSYIKKLSCKDKSGFHLQNFSGVVSLSSTFLDINKLHIKTPESELRMDLLFEYDSFPAFNDFVELVDIDVVFDKAVLNLEDIAYFAPDMFGMYNKIGIDGNFRGTVSNLRGRDVIIKYADHTSLNGDFRLTGLPDISNTFINFNIDMLTTKHADLNSFLLPNSNHETISLSLPDALENLDLITFSGNFTGFIDDFVAYGDFNSALGKIKSDLLVRRGDHQEISYRGQLAVSEFDIGSLIAPQSGLDKISFDFDLQGKGLSLDNADLTVNGTISSFVFNDYNYKNISINGDLVNKMFTGYLDIFEDNIDMDFQGIVDFSHAKPLFDFSMDINKVKLHKLRMTNDEVERTLSAYLKCRFNGTNIEDIGGLFRLNDITFTEDDKSLEINEIFLTNAAEDNKYKNLVIHSELFQFNIEGFFKYSDLPSAFAGLLNNYLPSYVKHTDTEIPALNDTRFSYNLKLLNSKPLTDFFITAFEISDDFFITGQFNGLDGLLSVDAASDYIFINNMLMQNWFLNVYPKANTLKVNSGARHFILNEDMQLDDLSLNAQSREDSIVFDLQWFNIAKNMRNSGDINGFLSFEDAPEIELKFLRGRIFINDSLWVVNPLNRISFDTSAIAISDLSFSHKDQMIKIDGHLSEDAEKSLDLSFDNFGISDFNPLLAAQNIQLDGILSGYLSIYDVYGAPGFITDIKIDNFHFNDDMLGNLILNSNWDRQAERIYINSDIIYVGSIGSNRPFAAQGYYYPNREEDALDIHVTFENFRLELIQAYLSSFSSDFRGLATGQVHIEGSTAQPDFNGLISLRRASLKIDYLNTIYSFSDDIAVSRNALTFDNITLNDVRGDRALFNGQIQHENFNNMVLDLNFSMQNFMCLNTTMADNDDFYGTAFATGSVRIHGPVDNITMDILARTERQTRIFLPLQAAGEVRENRFITFVQHDIIEENEVIITEARTEANLTLNLDLEVTPESEVQIIFDAQVGDIIRARGNGNIQMEINMLGDFRMFGDYIIQEGDYLFTLQNVINKRFRIEQGSRINWVGDPMTANANIKAIYQLRAPLHDLFIATADTSREHRNRVPVNCILDMSGYLFNPEIAFDIDLPASDENTRNQLRSIVNTEAEMNRQMFALLALNRFLPPTSDFAGMDIATGLEATSTEMLSNQLSNWLSQISSDFDLGVNYRMGDEITSDEVEVALSTQLFNDRVLIDGSVGTSATGQNTSQLVGDVNVELMITEDGKFRLKFYNKSNTFDMLKHTAPYTQGVGLFYRREFDSFNELLRRNN